MAKKKKKKNRRKQPLASGQILHIPMPADLPKMSAVILKLAEPLLSKYGTTPQRIETIISLTIAGWNKTLFSASEQATIEKELIESLVSEDASPDTGALTSFILNLIAVRREQLFPNFNMMIVGYECIFSGGKLTLNVSSTPIPDLR